MIELTEKSSEFLNNIWVMAERNIRAIIMKQKRELNISDDLDLTSYLRAFTTITPKILFSVLENTLDYGNYPELRRLLDNKLISTVRIDDKVKCIPTLKGIAHIRTTRKIDNYINLEDGFRSEVDNIIDIADNIFQLTVRKIEKISKTKIDYKECFILLLLLFSGNFDEQSKLNMLSEGGDECDEEITKILKKWYQLIFKYKIVEYLPKVEREGAVLGLVRAHLSNLFVKTNNILKVNHHYSYHLDLMNNDEINESAFEKIFKLIVDFLGDKTMTIIDEFREYYNDARAELRKCGGYHNPSFYIDMKFMYEKLLSDRKI